MENRALNILPCKNLTEAHSPIESEKKSENKSNTSVQINETLNINYYQEKVTTSMVLQTIFSDHNYCVFNADQEGLGYRDNDVIDLKRNILDYILKSNFGKFFNETSNLENYIDSIIKNIDLHVEIDKFNESEKTKFFNNDNSKQEKLTEDLILENVMDVLATEEDDGVYKKEEAVSDSAKIVKKIRNASVTLAGNFNKQKSIEDNIVEYPIQRSYLEKIKTNLEPSIFQNTQSSKPLNISNGFSKIQRLSLNSDSMSIENLTCFAKKFYDDCIRFQDSALDSCEKIETFVINQIRLLQNLIPKKSFLVNTAIQTDSKICAMKNYLANEKEEEQVAKDLIDSESLTESSIYDLVEIDKKKNNHKKEGFSHFNEYDDGIPMRTYIQSEIFESNRISDVYAKYPKKGGKKISSLFKFGRSSVKTMQSIVGITQVCDSFKKNKSFNESDKENNGKLLNDTSDCSDDQTKTDKEIERLININALEKRSAYYGVSKTVDEDCTKCKHPKKLDKKKIDFSKIMEEEHCSNISDGSVYETDDENLTEEQYLQKRNDNLKQELLCPSSSEDDELLEFGCTISEEDRSKSPLVDKFLKNFVVSGTDSAKKNEDYSDLDSHESLELILTNFVHNKGESKNKLNAEMLQKTEFSFDKIKKNGKHKSLEKMLSEAEKRKKVSKIDDDLISLSSTSNDSDIESIEDDNTSKKSRIIKQMLRTDQLATDTRKAQKEENERIKRLEKKTTRLLELLKNMRDSKQNEFILDYIEESKTFIKVHNGIVKHLKKHQFDGVKFMYDSCFGSVNNLNKFYGSGCILAHCMGLGKTLQLIALLHTVITYKELNTSKILVLCPKSTVMNWADEIKRWLDPLNTRNYRVYAFNDTSDINEKLNIIKKWSMSSFGNSGFLLIGYEAFRTLVFYHSYKNRSNSKPTQTEEIRDKVKKYLLKPGADLVVCDEGHIIKNNRSAISLAVSKITTPRRIVLTGTPIQNNLKEYYSMVNFIKPSFLGTEKEFANLYANPIKNGQHKDSSKLDIKIMKQRSFVLHKKLSRFVQRKEAQLLKTFLPEKFEYVLFVPMTEVQNNLYEYILEAIAKRRESKGKSLITDYTCLRKIWTHPKVLEDAWKNAIEQKNKNMQKGKTPNSDDDQPDDIYDSQTGIMSVTNDWWRYLLSTNQLESILPSNKLRATFEILRMCEENGEKCLIFSAFVAVLNVVEYFFKKINNKDPVIMNELGVPVNQKASNIWVLGKDYYRLDGKTPKSLRHEMIKQFNIAENRRARVFLISAKAGGQGINLIGANRVIILDTSWNPSNDQQNIFRIFRLGQKRKCYIYRLLAMGTMEEKVYSRSVTKQAMSFRVMDEQQIDRHYSMAELTELYTLTKPDFIKRPTPVVPQDSILASLLLNLPKVVYKYHEHDSLLENKIEQELSEQEKKDAWIAYERDLQMNTQLPNIAVNTDNGILGTSRFTNNITPMSMFEMTSLPNSGISPFNPLVNPYARGHYNFSTGTSQQQQYLEMLHLYQKYLIGYQNDSFVNSSLVYPPLDNCKATNPTINSNIVSPLAALGDLSVYGMSIQKPKTSNITPFTNNIPNLIQNFQNYNKTSTVSCVQLSGQNTLLNDATKLNSNSSTNSFPNLIGSSSSQVLNGDLSTIGSRYGLISESGQDARHQTKVNSVFEPITPKTIKKIDELKSNIYDMPKDTQIELDIGGRCNKFVPIETPNKAKNSEPIEFLQDYKFSKINGRTSNSKQKCNKTPVSDPNKDYVSTRNSNVISTSLNGNNSYLLQMPSAKLDLPSENILQRNQSQMSFKNSISNSHVEFSRNILNGIPEPGPNHPYSPSSFARHLTLPVSSSSQANLRILEKNPYNSSGTVSLGPTVSHVIENSTNPVILNQVSKFAKKRVEKTKTLINKSGDNSESNIISLLNKVVEPNFSKQVLNEITTIQTNPGEATVSTNIRLSDNVLDQKGSLSPSIATTITQSQKLLKKQTQEQFKAVEVTMQAKNCKARVFNTDNLNKKAVKTKSPIKNSKGSRFLKSTRMTDHDITL